MRRRLPTIHDTNRAAKRTPPTVESARNRLGGRGLSENGAGHLVEIASSEETKAGVVLFVVGDELDVWMGNGRVQRLARAQLRPLAKTPDRELLTLAAEVRAFTELPEGARVRYVEGTSLQAGTLVEKCRYGAIVLRDDQRIIAVGFRKLLPATDIAPH